MRTQQALLTTLLFTLGCTGTIDTHGTGATGGGDDSTTGGGSSSGGDDGTGGTGGSDGSGSDGQTGGRSSPIYPTQHPRIYLGSQAARLNAALAAHTPAADRFSSFVTQWENGADLWDFPAWAAALRGALTHNSNDCSKAIADVENQVSTAEGVIASGGSPDVARDSYLYSGEMLGNVILTYDWCFDQVSASQKQRWIAYADQTVWNIWHPDQAKYGSTAMPWSGWSVDNPSNNYYYSFLKATMLLGLATKGENPNADQWIAQFRTAKLGNELVPTFDRDLTGGGSREGTGYGNSMRKLFELYELWEATTGERIADLTPHTRASMLDWIHLTMPTLDRTAPIGDHSRDSSSAFFDYDRHYLLELATLFPTDALAGRVKAMLASSSVPQMGQGFMAPYDFIDDRPTVATTQLAGLDTTYYAPGTGVVATRSDWSKQATWVGLIAGPYTESHAHQDQGSLMIFKNDWLAYDACHDTHSGVRQELDQHAMVRLIRGGATVQQHQGTTSQVLGLQRGTGWMHVAADVTAAYGGDGDVQKVQREMVYLAPDVLVVYDRVKTSASVTQSWSLASPNAPSISGANATLGGLVVQRLVPASASSSSYSFAANDSDYRGGFRLDENVGGGDQRYLHVLSTAGHAVNAQAIGDNGVTVTLPDGRVAVITFDRDSAGATMVLAGATIALPATMTALPETI